MRKKMTLDDVKNFYHTTGAIESMEGFEVSDPRAELMYVLPKEFRTFIEGRPLDPKKLLTLRRDYPLDFMLGCDFRTDPLYLKYTCGIYEERDGGRRFYPADFAVPANDRSITAVLICAHWDMREGVTDMDWAQKVRSVMGEDLLYSHCDADDDYDISGEWYWVLRADMSCYPMVHYANFFAMMFAQTMNPVVAMAEEQWEQFEKRKDRFREIILDIVKPLREVNGWSVDDTDPNQTIVTYRDKPGKQSPQVYKFRHDSVGRNLCAEQFHWVSHAETLG